MQDGIMKGTGNSRYLKSIADFLTQYPTYQEFAAALAAGRCQWTSTASTKLAGTSWGQP